MEPTQKPAPGTFSWTEEHNVLLRTLQVDELFRFAPVATIYSYFGALLTLLVFIDTNDTERGLYWFSLATAVTLFRSVVIWRHHHHQGGQDDPQGWARLIIVANFFAGIQWGLLGTLLFPAQQSYRELFSLMVITCYVGGSITSYAAVKWAHPALALPAIVPSAIYIFFVYDGVHLYAGGAALFFCFAVNYYAFKLNRDIEQRLRLLIQNQQLLSGTRTMYDSLARENQELAHRAAVRLRSKLSAREHAHTLSAHFENTPLPVLECDPQYRLLAWNRAAQKVFGYDQAEALGNNLAALLLPQDKHAKAAPFMARLFQEKRSKSITTVAIAKGGRLLRLTCHVTPIFTQSGDPLHIAVIVSEMEDAGGLTQVAQVA